MGAPSFERGEESLLILAGFAIGLVIYGALVLARCTFRVEEGELAVLTTFGAVERANGGQTLVTHGPGLHGKLPWQKVVRVSMKEQNLELSGEAGLTTFSSKNATSVWKDSYTFVVSCQKGTAVAVVNPVRPEPGGTPLAQILTFGPKSGAQIVADFCTAGRQPHGGWVEYNFPEPGQSQATRKVSYLLAAQGTPYMAGAGLHDEMAKLEDLDRLAGDQQ